MRQPALGAFLGFTDDDIIAVRTRNSASDQYNVLRLTDLDDQEVLGGAAYLAQMAGHLHPAHDRAWEQALANGARAPMPALRAVRRVAAAERMAGDYALEPAPLGEADSVHEIARGKECRADHVARLHFLREVAKLEDALNGHAVKLLDVAQPRLGEPPFLLVAETKLHRVIAVALLRLALKHAVRAGEHNGHRGDHPFRVIDARLAQFLT